MGSALEQFLQAGRPKPRDDLLKWLAEQRAQSVMQDVVLAQSPDQAGPRDKVRLNMERMIPSAPLPSRGFVQDLGYQQGEHFTNMSPAVQQELAKLQPAVDKLGSDYDYARLAQIADEQKDKLSPGAYFKLAGTAALGLATAGKKRSVELEHGALVAGHEFAETMTAGQFPDIPNPEAIQLSPQGQAIAKAVGSIAGIAVSGKLIVSGLSLTTKIPAIGPVLLQIPQRVREVMLGVGTGAILDAARPDGLPADPAAIDVSARMAHPIAHFLGDGEAAQRTALGISGGLVGGVLGEVLGPVLRGMENARSNRMLEKIDASTIALIKTNLQAAGIAVESGADNKAVIAKLLRNLDKLSLNEKLASVAAADETRMGFVLNHLYTHPEFKGNDDARYLAGVFRANPGGLSIVQGVAESQMTAPSQRMVNAFDILNDTKISLADKGAILQRDAAGLQEYTSMQEKLANGNLSPDILGIQILKSQSPYITPEMLAKYPHLQAPRTALPSAAEQVVKQMGLNVVSIKAGKDVIIMRPKIAFQQAPTLGSKMKNQIADFTDFVRAIGKGKPSTQLTIMNDGTIVRGNYNAAEMIGRYKIKPAVVEGTAQTEVALREHFGIMDVRVGDGGVVTVNLPSQVTQRQVNALGRMIDRGPPQVVINSARPGVSMTLDQPFGMQVEDAIGNLVEGAGKPKITADVVKKVQQYQKEGVFQGQAGVLPDGYPVEIIKKVGKKVIYRDPITGNLHRTVEDAISVLPTSLEGELQPSRQIFEALTEQERGAFAGLRRGINEGLTKPISTVRELEGFASTRGKQVTALSKGKIRVFDPLTGESKVYDSLRSAITGVRGSLGPLPDLTPPEIEELLGFKPNIGGMGTNVPPAAFGDYIPVSEAEFAKAFETNTVGMLPPGAVGQFYEPTRGLSESLTKKYNMPFDKVFANLQSGTVHRQNFVATWAHGKGPGLPEGIMPLADIWKLADKPGDGVQSLMTAWLESESDAVARASIAKELTPKQIRAAEELRKWYGLSKEDGLFKSLQIEAEWLTDYAPHIREHAEGFGGNLVEGWRVSRGTPLPKSVEYFADFARDGSLNVYETRAFHAAAQYLGAGARSRFLNQAMDDAKRLLRAIPDNAVKGPLVNYIEAIRGWEFTPQRAAMDASFANILRTLGASEQLAKDVGERMTMGLLGLSYQATMGYRPGLAIRNAAQIFQTTWPLLGTVGSDAFAEGIGRALTTAGRSAAVRAGAINLKQSAIFAGDEAMASLPQWLQTMNETGFKLYDTADMFTRSVTFNVAKIRSERAIVDYGKALKAGKDAAVAQRALIKESGAMVLSPRFTQEYLRRVATSPESAGDFLGKQLTDIAQFLYGRGNQPRWMRTVPGRFFGQFGTWPLWYVDYVRRSFTNMWGNGFQKEALGFLGKIAMVDMAIYESGRRVNLDLRRWMSGNALFGLPPLGQPPAVNALYGMAQLARGLSEEVLGTYDSPANKQRLASARETLAQAGTAFIPNMYAVRDIGRLMNAKTPTEVAAVMLATRPTTDYTVEQRLGLLFAPGRMSTDIDLENAGDQTPTATELMLRGMNMAPPKLQVPQGNLPAQPPGATPMPSGQMGGSESFKVKASVSGRPPMESTALPESIRTGESKPNLQ
jgi:hypothetical protein